MTRGTKNRYERSCPAHKGVGYVERKLLLLYLPQGDIGQVAGIRLGMFLPHIAVGTEALHLDLSLAQFGHQFPLNCENSRFNLN